MNTIKVSDFTEYPGLRYCDLSEKSGEEFYHEVLNEAFYKAYQEKNILNINLDDTAGYASSFLDEAFGNLVYDFTLEVVKGVVRITTIQEPHWKEIIEDSVYTKWEGRRKKGEAPKTTRSHTPWYRLKDGKLVSKKWDD